MEQSIDEPDIVSTNDTDVPVASTKVEDIHGQNTVFRRDHVYRHSLDKQAYKRLQNANSVKVGAKNNISDLKKLFENNGNKNSEITKAHIDKRKGVIYKQTAFTTNETNNNNTADKQAPFAFNQDKDVQQTNAIVSPIINTVDNNKCNVVNDCSQEHIICEDILEQTVLRYQKLSDTSIKPSLTNINYKEPIDVAKRTSSDIEKLQSNLKKSYFDDSPIQLRKKPTASKDSPRTSEKRVSFSSEISKIPIPAPRKSLLARENAHDIHPIEVITVEVSNIEREIVTPVLIPSSKNKYNVNPHYIKKAKRKHSNIDLNKIQFADPEEKHIIARASSEDSIDKIESDLSEFIMDDKKEKKRSNSFSRIFKGKFSRKDKKREEDKKKINKPQNEVAADNAQNESFNRSSSVRHTTDERSRKVLPQVPDANRQLEQRYAQLYINSFQQKKENFQHMMDVSKCSEDYVCMNKSTSAAINNPVNYTNTSNVNKYIDTSSSSNTIDSENIGFDRARDSDNSNYSNPPEKVLNTNAALRNKFFERSYAEIPEKYLDTPPRAYDTYQNVQLVKPKANIPINSERSLPLPYQEMQQETIERNLNSFKEAPIKRNVNVNKAEFSDGIYGTVYDRKLISNRSKPPSPDVRSQSSEGSLHSARLGSRSPSLEGSKLKLPANRDKVDLQPRIKSPIPQNVISTDKIIATELLKTKKDKKDDKRTSPSHQRLEIEIDYPDNSFEHPIESPKTMEVFRHGLEPVTMRKPPISPISPQTKNVHNLEAGEWHKKQRDLSQSPSVFQPNTQLTTNVMVHVDSQSTLNRPCTPIHDIRSRSTTPIVTRSPSSTASLQRTPPKQEIRQNVEAFCWKELKKLKEQEDMQIQMQLSNYGYAEDPGISHRSRSMSPAVNRSARRSASLPREVERQRRMHESEIVQRRNREVPVKVGPPNENYGYNQNFIRNSPQRSTVGSANISRNDYEFSDIRQRPIFRRGSLTQHYSMEPQYIYNKKVSFHSPQNPENPSSWPTKNGYTQSPPQRRLEVRREHSLEDEVFLPDPRKILSDDVDSLSKEPIYATKPPIYNRMPNTEMPSRKEIFYMNEQRQKQMKEHDMQGNISKPIYDFRPLPNERMYVVKQQAEEPLYATRAQMEREQIYDSRVQLREPIYATRTLLNISEEPIYGIRRNTQEPIYATKQYPQVQNRPSLSRYDYPSEESSRVSRMVARQHPQGNQYNKNFAEPIYTQQPINSPIYGTKQNVQDQLYGHIGAPKVTTVNNKVCDMYGKIHETPEMTSPQSSQKTGVLYGQLQRNSNAAPLQYQSYNHLRNTNFVRGTRLTASVNDMHRHYQQGPRYHHEMYDPPDRPLPPVPNGNKSKFPFMRRQPQSNASDTESNASEVQRIFSNREQASKNRGIVGK